MKLGMMACCAVTLLPLGAFLVAGGTLGGLPSSVWLLLPIVLCLGMHFLLHRVMGRSCNENTTEIVTVHDDGGAVGASVPKVDAAR